MARQEWQFGGWAAVRATAVAFFLAAAGSAFAADSVTLTQAAGHLGNIFSSTDTVQIPVQTTGDHVSWTATDFFGAVTNGSSVAVDGQGNATILPNLGRLGWFSVHVTALRAGTAVATADTTMAVVPPDATSTKTDSPFGINTHFAQQWDPAVFQILTHGGISQFRDEQYWQNIEPNLTSPPTYTFPGIYTAYMSAAAASGANPLITLDFANPNYDGGNTPYDSTGYAGYMNYALAVLKQFNPQIQSVAIWNEYNGTYCVGPATANRPAYYAAMLETIYPALKAYNPSLTVVGGACVPIPLTWYQDLFNVAGPSSAPSTNALDYMDAVDIHPYRAIPENVEVDIAQLQALMAQYNHGKGAKPVWATECGTPDTVNLVGRQLMASYLVRLYTLMLSARVQRTYWYLLFDYDGYSTGLVRGPTDSLGAYAPSSAYPAYANLIHQLYGASFVRSESADPRTRIYLFHRTADSADVRVVWAATGTANLVFTTSTALTMLNIMGESQTVQPTGGTITLQATGTPFYLVGTVASVAETGRDVLMADSVRDFSGVQGTTPGTWRYGYYTGDINAYSANYLTAFEPGVWTRTVDDYEWLAPAPAQYGTLTEYGTHPDIHPIDPNTAGSLNTPLWSVRRWQSNVSATVTLAGIAVRSYYGDGDEVKIFVDGALVYDSTVLPLTTVNFSFTQQVNIGSMVDFVVTPGPNGSQDITYDYLDFRAQISATAPTTFSAWQNRFFTSAELSNSAISGPTASPAGDGVSNLLKYAANLNPKTPLAVPLSTAGTTTVSASTYLTLSVRQAKAATDLTFQPQFNGSGLNNASAWQAGGVLVGTPVDNGDGSVTATYRDTVPISTSTPKRFTRLQVTQH